MRLHPNQIPPLAKKLVKALIAARDIDAESPREVERDVEAVLESYVREVDAVQSRAREIVQQRGMPTGEFGRAVKHAAEKSGIKVGEDALDFVLDQLLEMLMHSNNIDEVFAADHDLRRRMRPLIVAAADLDKEVDLEVRSKLKHVQEGTRTWEIEYARMMDEIRRRKGV
ncbi:MAG: DUF507 family protein [Myxococcales bacterium]|nr:DUF507 family protein [Myxococcales bacterium]